MDSLLKSLAKDQQPQEANNESTVAVNQKDSELSKPSFTVDNAANSSASLVPNNQIGAISLSHPRSPIPPESLKCNILKAKSLEMRKSSNLLTITPIENSSNELKKNICSDAATIVSVVSRQKCGTFLMPAGNFFFLCVKLTYLGLLCREATSSRFQSVARLWRLTPLTKL